jgi:hypothetical protein
VTILFRRGVLTFDTIWQALLRAASYLAIHVTEGAVTPTLLARLAFELNRFSSLSRLSSGTGCGVIPARCLLSLLLSDLQVRLRSHRGPLWLWDISSGGGARIVNRSAPPECACFQAADRSHLWFPWPGQICKLGPVPEVMRGAYDRSPNLRWSTADCSAARENFSESTVENYIASDGLTRGAAIAFYSVRLSFPFC